MDFIALKLADAVGVQLKDLLVRLLLLCEPFFVCAAEHLVKLIERLWKGLARVVEG